MSTSDWSPKDLSDIGNTCLLIYQYHDDASEDLKPLLVKYKNLGRQLHTLSEVLQTSGRSHEFYHDPELETHIHDAKICFEKYFAITGGIGGLSNRLPRRRLKQDRITKLHQQVDDHHSKAKEFKIDVLLLTALKKLEFLQPEPLRSSGGGGSGLSTAVDAGIASDEPDSPGHETQAISGNLGNSQTEDDSTSVLTGVTGAFQLARIVWAGRANRYRPRRQPGVSSSPRVPILPANDGGSARDQFVHDVVEVINETRLYAEETVPQEVLNKLNGIVSKAVRLENTLTSPEISALQNIASPSPEASAPQRRILPSQAGGTRRNGSLQSAATGAGQHSIFASPEIIASNIGDAGSGLPEIQSDPETFPASIIISLNERSEEFSIIGRLSRDFNDSSSSLRPGTLNLGAPAMSISGSSVSVVASSDSQSEALFPYGSRTIEEEVDGITDRRVLREEGWQGWVEISCRLEGLKPTPCTLEITESAGSICVEAFAIPRRTTAGSMGGSVQSERTSAPSTSFERSLNENSNLTHSRTFKHLFTPDARPIPLVQHPRYEGPKFAPDEPYTITFTEKQVFREDGINEPLRRVVGLKYSFSDEAYRDRVRSLIFGKELLVSTGVKKISFHYIACERQAVSLWFDTRANYKTITFYRTSTDRRGRRPDQVEYKVLGIEESRSAEDNEEPLVLFLNLLPDTEASRSQPERTNTFLSAISRRSTKSTIVGDSDRCSLFFSDITGKTMFLQGLEGRQSA